MEYLDKLDFQFTAGQVLKAELMNIMKERVNELVDSANTLPEMRAFAKETRMIVDSDIDISQAEFEALQEQGQLDPTKNYYIYEE